jgi:hypothetical protein
MVGTGSFLGEVLTEDGELDDESWLYKDPVVLGVVGSR